jgi:hypothetical protein
VTPLTTDPFAPDRMEEVPAFYTLTHTIDEIGIPLFVAGAVVTQTGGDTRCPFRAGLVSRTSPLGQSGGLGINPETDLRPATPDEIRAALRRRHPLGRSVPIPDELRDVWDHLLWAGAVSNWTNDNGDGVGTSLTHSQLLARRDVLERQYRRMRRRWWLIVWRQRRAIRASLPN